MNRRQFVKITGTAITLPIIVPSTVLSQFPPSERITLALIGVGNQGTNNLKGFLQLNEAQVVAVCDVNRASYGYKTASQFLGREPACQLVNEHYATQNRNSTFAGCEMATDFREILERPDIDAVVITVPDHWHAVMAIAAARAGKDIYCEKPMTLTIAEGRHMIHAVRRHGIIFQTGSHERSNIKSRFVCELVRNGYIGQLKRIVTTVGPNNKTAPESYWTPDPIPEGFDYDTWLGPAPYAPYHKDRCLYNFRFGEDYSGGQTTNYGAHSNDLAQWGNNTEYTGPVEVENIGGIWPQDGLFTTATYVHFRARYVKGVELICQTGPENMQVRFEGTEGFIRHGYRGSSCYPENLWNVTLGPNDIRLGTSTNHYLDFLNAVKTRTDPAAPIEIGHYSATLCHLGNIAMKRRRKLLWDPAKEYFTNDEMANRMLSKPYRAPWHL
ncbi:MAG: Gfo/Idh/MocA family oxidoreductase [Sedimentisphaerales bacterium]|nr:Gfo/Idh/MocA family oxidoreductase [Sedimentisphaerales bacterium]